MAVWSPAVTEKLTGKQFFIQLMVVCFWGSHNCTWSLVAQRNSKQYPIKLINIISTSELLNSTLFLPLSYAYMWLWWTAQHKEINLAIATAMLQTLLIHIFLVTKNMSGYQIINNFWSQCTCPYFAYQYTISHFTHLLRFYFSKDLLVLHMRNVTLLSPISGWCCVPHVIFTCSSTLYCLLNWLPLKDLINIVL